MKSVEILTIGREILDGRVIDTNSVFLGESLTSRGLVPRHAQRVDDDLPRMVDAFRLAATRSQIILVTGGLGPTSDDLSAQAFAQFLDEDVELNTDALKAVEAFFKRIDRVMIPAQRKQAMLPPSCFILPNPEGSAPGFGLERDGRQWFFMPGIPREMKRMFSEQILPRLQTDPSYQSYSWATHFTSEGELQQRLSKISQRLPRHFELTYRTRFPENHIGLHAACKDEGERIHFAALLDEISSTLGKDSFSSGTQLRSLEEILIDELRSQKVAVATVESCTGGLVANRITDVAGSSEVFLSGQVCYDNQAKIALGVNPATLKAYGAVSAETAMELAQSGLQQLSALKSPHKKLACIATTGIAGPGGGSSSKPVGLCYVAIARSRQAPLCLEIKGRPDLDRKALKLFFSQKALDLLLQNT